MKPDTDITRKARGKKSIRKRIITFLFLTLFKINSLSAKLPPRALYLYFTTSYNKYQALYIVDIIKRDK